MNIRFTHTQLALLALILKILLISNNTTLAVVAPGQYSSFLPQSYYSHSLSSYGNENRNYFDNPAEPSSSASETYNQRQPTDSNGNIGVDGGDSEQDSFYHQSDSFQPQSSYQDYLSEKFSPFRQEQDFALDTYGKHYSTRLAADGGAVTSSLVSFDNIDSNNSDIMNYGAPHDVVYPPLDSGMHQQYQEQPMQQYLQLAGDMTANNFMSASIAGRVNSLQSLPFLSDENIPKDNTAVSINAGGAQTTLTMTRPPIPPRTVERKPYNENDYQQQHQQDQQHIQRPNQHQPQPASHFEAEYTATSNNNDRLSDNSPIRTYYVADSDLSASKSNHLPDPHQPLSLLQSHLVQLPVVPSPPPPPPAPAPVFAIPNEPIPISKHVQITKHIPVPIYRQIHVPYRKPVRIEIPRPVISTAPRPYPIQIPSITKTIAVPLVKEVKIPIEKVTPYPVEHKVPYVVEKRVPFQVEKQVAAPKYYPFPVKVPMVRTILHKKKAYMPMLHYHHPRFHML